MLSVRRWAARLGIHRPPTDFEPVEGNWDDIQAMVRTGTTPSQRAQARRRLTAHIRRNQSRKTRYAYPDQPRTRISRIDINRDRVDWPVITSAPTQDEGFHYE